MSEKDAYYFPHFCNARHDRKVKRVIKELGVEGYGIFFMLLEVLRDQTDFNFPMEDIDLLADEFNTSEQKVRTVICNYQLFEIDEEKKFFSPKMLVYLEPFFKMKEQRRLAGIASGEKRRLALNDRERPLNENEQSKVKESKENIVNEIEILYSLYPTTCKNRKQSTGKCLKDKEKIAKLIKSYGYEQLTNIFNHYLKDKDTIYLKNFSTFLNNLPDPEAIADEVIHENKWPTNRPQNEIDQILEWFHGPEYTRKGLMVLYYNNKYLKESEYDYLVKLLQKEGRLDESIDSKLISSHKSI